MGERGERILLGTRKGLFVLRRARGAWDVEQHAHVGIPVAYAFEDARGARPTLWTSLDHGHWGQKLARSRDGGASFEEVAAPKYPEGAEAKAGVPATLAYIWCLTAGAESQPGRLYAGTEPGGLFVSDDEGASWRLDEALWTHPSRPEHWFGGGRDQAAIHSILVDPRDPACVTLGISVSGVFQTRDGGATWHGRNRGLRADYAPEPFPEFGHDPHCVVRAPTDPDVLWQQNHCGVFMSRDGGENWKDVSEEGGPVRFGFAVAISERAADTAWVIPGQGDERRTTIDGALRVHRTEDGGASWTSVSRGLPARNAWDIVYRHGLDRAGENLAFGSTTGNAYWSPDGGEGWECLGNHFPPIYSVRFA